MEASVCSILKIFKAAYPPYFRTMFLFFSIQDLFHPPYNVLTVLSNLCQGNEISFHFYIKTTVRCFLILNDAWSHDGLNRWLHLVTNVNF
jgi:hypothetical protein